VDSSCLSSPSFPKRGLGEILIPLASPSEKGRGNEARDGWRKGKNEVKRKLKGNLKNGKKFY
jgi:hypothetical protein